MLADVVQVYLAELEVELELEYAFEPDLEVELELEYAYDAELEVELEVIAEPGPVARPSADDLGDAWFGNFDDAKHVAYEEAPPRRLRRISSWFKRSAA